MEHLSKDFYDVERCYFSHSLSSAYEKTTLCFVAVYVAAFESENLFQVHLIIVGLNDSDCVVLLPWMQFSNKFEQNA